MGQTRPLTTFTTRHISRQGFVQLCVSADIEPDLMLTHFKDGPTICIFEASEDRFMWTYTLCGNVTLAQGFDRAGQEFYRVIAPASEKLLWDSFEQIRTSFDVECIEFYPDVVVKLSVELSLEALDRGHPRKDLEILAFGETSAKINALRPSLHGHVLQDRSLSATPSSTPAMSGTSSYPGVRIHDSIYRPILLLLGST